MKVSGSLPYQGGRSADGPVITGFECGSVRPLELGSGGVQAVGSEPVTIHDYLRRRGTATMIGSVTLLFAMGLARTHLEAQLAWSAFVLGIIAIAGLNWRLYRTECPNCSKPIGYTAFWTYKGVLDGINKCPHCDIAFDNPMPNAGS